MEPIIKCKISETEIFPKIRLILFYQDDK